MTHGSTTPLTPLSCGRGPACALWLHGFVSAKTKSQACPPASAWIRRTKPKSPWCHWHVTQSLQIRPSPCGTSGCTWTCTPLGPETLRQAEWQKWHQCFRNFQGKQGQVSLVFCTLQVRTRSLSCVTTKGFLGVILAHRRMHFGWKMLINCESKPNQHYQHRILQNPLWQEKIPWHWSAEACTTCWCTGTLSKPMPGTFRNPDVPATPRYQANQTPHRPRALNF